MEQVDSSSSDSSSNSDSSSSGSESSSDEETDEERKGQKPLSIRRLSKSVRSLHFRVRSST